MYISEGYFWINVQIRYTCSENRISYTLCYCNHFLNIYQTMSFIHTILEQPINLIMLCLVLSFLICIYVCLSMTVLFIFHLLYILHKQNRSFLILISVFFFVKYFLFYSGFYFHLAKSYPNRYRGVVAKVNQPEFRIYNINMVVDVRNNGTCSHYSPFKK